jgi:hypothetical protein
MYFVVDTYGQGQSKHQVRLLSRLVNNKTSLHQEIGNVKKQFITLFTRLQF